jgi:hypothetical protein
MSDVAIRRPSGTPIRVSVRGGASRLTLDTHQFGAVGGETRWETADFDQATDRYDLEISGGANGLTVGMT